MSDHIPPTNEELELWREEYLLPRRISYRLIDEIQRLRGECGEFAAEADVALTDKSRLAIWLVRWQGRLRAAAEGK